MIVLMSINNTLTPLGFDYLDYSIEGGKSRKQATITASATRSKHGTTVGFTL